MAKLEQVLNGDFGQILKTIDNGTPIDSNLIWEKNMSNEPLSLSVVSSMMKQSLFDKIKSRFKRK